MKMITVTIANQKGGVGKSAVARLLSHYLVKQGRRVLAIDLDHQGNLTIPLQLSGKAATTAFTASQLLTNTGHETPAGELVVVPADSDNLLGLESQPDKRNDFARSMRVFLRSQVDKFDACIIDTNPNPDIRVQAALVSSNFALSPITLSQESISGIVNLVNHKRVGINRLKTINPALELMGLLPTLVEGTKLQREYLEDITAKYAHLLIRDQAGEFAMIPKRSIIAECQANGSLLWEIKGNTSAREVARELEPTLAAIAARMGL